MGITLLLTVGHMLGSPWTPVHTPAGLAVVTAEAFAVGAAHPAGARISLGGPSKRGVLERALGTLAELVSEGTQLRRAIV